MNAQLSATGVAGPLASKAIKERHRPFRAVWQQHWMLYVMLIPAAVLLALFHFYPLWGISLAFVDYNPFKGVSGSPFVGLGIFRDMVKAPAIGLIVRNTLLIAIGKIVFGQLASVVFALLIHRVAQPLFRRLVQTVTTLPHFMSWVIIGGAMVQILSTTGVVNTAIGAFGGRPIRFLGDPSIFPWTMVLLQTWKEFGFGAIIYLAALTAINPDLYEAAAVDGAGPAARLRHITLPGITPTIVLMACLSLGNVLNAGFEQVLVLYNPIVYSTGDILDTFVYRAGVLEAKFSLGTAVGLLKSVVGFFLILLSYWLADRLANYRIF
jgi:putative aldouronate transport system permease protein